MFSRSLGFVSVCAGLLLLPRPVSAQADLSVGVATVPYSGSANKAGDSFTAHYTIVASHAPVTSHFSVDFSYCDKLSSTSCELLGVQVVTASFSAGQIRVFYSSPLKLPSSVTYGTRYVQIKVDAGDDVAESNEGNNQWLASVPITALPDLSITQAKVASPQKANASFTAQLTLLNAANTSAITKAISLSYYYCTSKAASACTALGSEQVNSGLYSGASLNHSSIKLVIPATATSGSRHVRVLVDSTKAVAESNEANNELYAPLTIVDSMPDLSVDNTSAPHTGSMSHAGATFTARCRVRNKTSAALTQDFNLNYYYCLTSGSTACAFLGQKKVTNNLAGNSTLYVNSPSLTLPVTATLGTGYLRFFVDGTDLILETNEGNNDTYHLFKLTAKPDLLVSKATVPASGSVATPGAKFTVSYIVKNQSNTSAFSTSFWAACYYCPGLSASGCSLLGKQKVQNAFNSGATYVVNTNTLTMPATASPGMRYVRVLVDSAKDLDEADETNNDLFSPISVTAPVADAGVDAWDASADAGGDAAVADLALPDVPAPAPDTSGQGGGDVKTDLAGEGGNAWLWPDQALEGGAPDAAEKPGPPITASGCQYSPARGSSRGTLALMLALALALARASRARKRR